MRPLLTKFYILYVALASGMLFANENVNVIKNEIPKRNSKLDYNLKIEDGLIPKGSSIYVGKKISL